MKNTKRKTAYKLTNETHLHSFANANDSHITTKEQEEEFCRKELKLCEELKILPDVYMSIKELLVIECINEGFI